MCGTNPAVGGWRRLRQSKRFDPSHLQRIVSGWVPSQVSHWTVPDGKSDNAKSVSSMRPRLGGRTAKPFVLGGSWSVEIEPSSRDALPEARIHRSSLAVSKHGTCEAKGPVYVSKCRNRGTLEAWN